MWRHDVAYLRRPDDIGRHPVIIDFANSMYARPEGEHLTLVALEDGNPLGGSPDAPAQASTAPRVSAGIGPGSFVIKGVF